ncbi:MAG: translocation/assembly module TamB domain-containing protein [Burkholderiales bacterium]
MKRAWLALATLTVLAVAAAFAGLAWLVGTEAGLQWAVARAVSASDGRLAIAEASGTLRAEVRIGRVAYADGAIRVQAQGVRGQGNVLALLRGALGIEPLHIASLLVVVDERKAATPDASPDLTLPFAIRLAQVAIGRFELQTADERHLLSDLNFSTIALGPRTLSALGSFTRPDERFPARVEVQVKGSFARLEAALDATIAGIPAHATLIVAPLDTPALRSLEARAGPVDFEQIDPALPRTSLSAVLQLEAARGAYAGTMSFANASPAALDAGGLPIVAMNTRFTSADFASGSLQQLRVELPGGGTLAGTGEIDARHLRAAVEVHGLDPSMIYSTLRRLDLQGRLDIALARGEQSVRGTLSQAGMRLEGSAVRHGAAIDVQARLALERVNPAAFGPYPEGSIHGGIEAEGKLGQVTALDARWTLENSTLLGQAFASRGRARFSGARVTRAQAELKFGPSRASVRGDFGRAGDRLAWTLAIAELRDVLPDLAGQLQASGTLQGAWQDPEVKASAQVQALRLPGDDTPRTAKATLAGKLAQHEAQLSVDAPDTHIEARLAGGWHAERGWRGEVRSLTNAGLYPLRLAAPATLAISRGRVVIGPLEAQLEPGRLMLRELAWEGGQLRTSGEFGDLPARWLAVAAGIGEHVRSTMLVDGAWALTAEPRLIGTVQLRRASGDVAVLLDGDPIALALTEAALAARFEDGAMALTVNADSRYGTLILEGDIGPAPGPGGIGFGPQSALSLRARFEGAALSALAQPLETQARFDGKFSADLRASGTLGEPRLDGTLRATGVSLEMPRYGVHLKNGRLSVELDGERLRVAEFSIQGGAGEFTANGSLPLSFKGGGGKLAWSAREFGVLQRPDLRLAVSGEGAAGFDAGRISLTGGVRADRGHLRIERDRLPTLGEDVVIVGVPRKPPGAQARLPISLDVELDLGQNLSIDAEGLEGRLTGQLRFVGSEDGELRAYGRLQLVNATFLAFGRRLEISPGVLVFDGPLDNPGLQVTAWRRKQAVEAGVQVSGTVRVPRVQLVSQPAVPESERLSWLVLGRAPADANRTDVGMLQAAAGALLARGDAVPIDRRMARAVGLDEVTLRGGGELEGNVVAFGKRLSDRLYVSYEQGVGAVATNLLKLDYALGKRWSLRAESGTTSGGGLFYRFSWD